MSADILLTSPSVSVIHAPAANTQAQIVITGRPGFRHIIVGLTVSADAAPAAAVTFTIVDDTPGQMETFKIPAGAFLPIAINYNHGIPSAPGASVTATLPALGAAVSGVISLRYVSIRA